MHIDLHGWHYYLPLSETQLQEKGEFDPMSYESMAAEVAKYICLPPDPHLAR